MSDKTGTAQIGVIGMAVMGSNLARNFANHGYRTAIFNRTWSKTEAVAAAHPEAGFIASESLSEFVDSLEKPRRVVIMVKAGAGTDATIDALVPLLEPGDIVVDGGNAFFQDTRRREKALRDHDLHFVGAGISGGETGALEGPSIMPGGSPHSYQYVGKMLEDISAKVPGPNGEEPCCTYIGTDGAGHFVKMIHNGIEYADMQFIGEAYDLLKGAGLSATEAADVFATWNTGDLDSYLIEITSEVLRQVDAETGKPLVDVVVDAAGMKGTGTWTVQEALNLGVPAAAIAEAVFARAASSSPELRKAAQAALQGPDGTVDVADRDAFIEDVRQALWASKVVAYAQGLNLIKIGARDYGWDIDVAAVARIWRAGCIIRAKLLDRIANEYAAGNLETLLEAPSIAAGLAESNPAWRRVVGTAAAAGVPIPGFSSALSYYDLVR
ncbi:MAG: NADP-dependent phosphogluconate dehydrogenase, partial [Propioniciclava sp.]